MIPIDIQVSRSKVKVKGQAYSSYVGEGGGGAFVFYKQLYFWKIWKNIEFHYTRDRSWTMCTLYVLVIYINKICDCKPLKEY